MRVEALLCDAATVREGLLHVLGGGVTRTHRPGAPGEMGLDLALMLTLQPVEAKESHRLKVVVQDDDGKSIAELSGEFGVAPGPGSHAAEPVAIPMVLNMKNVILPKIGNYSVEILLDSQLVKSLPFAMAVGAAPGKSAPPKPPRS